MVEMHNRGAGIGKGIRRPLQGEAPRRPAAESGEEAHLPWGRRNYLILAAGGAAVAVGYLLLALGDITIAPILLVGGYLGLIPWGIVSVERRSL
jgi:hypothetical protein